MKNVFFTFCAALLILAPAALADWSENFDSYALGSSIIGQGGWECWEAGTGTDGYVTDDQAYSTPHSAGIIPTTDMVQPFAETGGTWTMTGWCYVPSGSTGDQYFIMLNQYFPDTNNWSVQIQFDSDAGNVIDYYSSSSTPIINDQWVKVNLDIHLDMNSYDIYYNDSFLASNAWQTSGSNAIAALDLFSDGGSTIYWDDLDLQGGGALEHTTWGSIKTILQ